MFIKTLAELKIYETENEVEMVSIGSLCFKSKHGSRLFNASHYAKCVAKRTDKLFVIVEVNTNDFEIYISDLIEDDDTDVTYFRGFVEGMFAARNESAYLSI